jgi:hypothetical protein
MTNGKITIPSATMLAVTLCFIGAFTFFFLRKQWIHQDASGPVMISVFYNGHSETEGGKNIAEAIDHVTDKMCVNLSNKGQTLTESPTLIINSKKPNQAEALGIFLYRASNDPAVSASLNDPHFERRNGTWRLVAQEREVILRFYQHQPPELN